jgi:N-methylhydantoinase A
VVFVNARVAAIGAVSAGERDEEKVEAATPCAPRSTRKAWFGDCCEVPVYALDDLRPGHTLDGPAIIEAETTTVMINAGDRLAVNGRGWLDIRIARKPDIDRS